MGFSRALRNTLYEISSSKYASRNCALQQSIVLLDRVIDGSRDFYFTIVNNQVRMNLCCSSYIIYIIRIFWCMLLFEGARDTTTLDDRIVSTSLCTYQPHCMYSESLSPFSSFLHQFDLNTSFIYHAEWSMSRPVFRVARCTKFKFKCKLRFKVQTVIEMCIAHFKVQ